MTEINIRPARTDEAPQLVNLLATAFADLPPARWLIPDDGDRPAVLHDYFAIFVDHGFAAGMIEVAANPADQPLSATIWWPGDDAGPDDYLHRRAEAAGLYVARFEIFDSLLAVAHPSQTHQYLGLAATWPAYQRRGCGTALLDHNHDRLDLRQTAAYLEASSRRSRDLYERLGYQQLGNPIQLPNGPQLFPMWRDPR